MYNYNEQSQVKRGEVYFADLGRDNIEGSEQMGERPCLVIQNNVGNYNSSTIIVASLTGQLHKNELPVHVKLEGYGRLDESIILCEQLKTISKTRLLNFCGALSHADMQKVDKAIQMSLGIIPLPQKNKETNEETTN